MKLLITGASGLIGSALLETLKHEHTLILMGRNKNKFQQLDDAQNNCTFKHWQELNAQLLKDVDYVIHLAGESIGNKRWSKAQKKIIIASRVETTSQMVAACCHAKEMFGKAPVLMNANAIGIYGLQKDLQAQWKTIYDEEATLPNPPQDFLAKVSAAWDNALMPARDMGLQVIQLRFAVVLSDKGGALAKMLPAFKWGLGSLLGSGKQPFSWVSLRDAVDAICFLMNKKEAAGAYNIVAPEVLSQREFAKQLAHSLKRPCFLQTPGFVIKSIFGQMGEELLLHGQNVRAKRLMEAGFQFKDNSLVKYLSTL